jgi:NAD(P)-dependent dehydrogenase (short-subunit alcohol dehydrogenase family)
MGQLAGNTTVVTGASTGIGLAAARRFAAEGAHVFVTGRRQETLDAAVAGIGANAAGVRGDIADLPDLDRLYAVAEQGRRVDVLFANAGGGEFRSCIALKGDSYRLKDRDLRRVPAAGTTEE